MPPKEKPLKNTQVKEDVKKLEDSQGSSKTPPVLSLNSTLPSISKSPSNQNWFQWGSHINQMGQKPQSTPTNGFQFSQQVPQPAKTEEEKSVTQLQLEMKRDNQQNAINNQNQNTELKNIIVAQENALAQKITESHENLKQMITNNANYFQTEIDKINNRFEENKKNIEKLIEAAIKAERARLEKNNENAKTNLAIQGAENLPAENPPTQMFLLPQPIPTHS